MKNCHSNLKKKLLRRQWRCWWAKNKENYYENDNGPAKWVQFGISSSVDARQWWKVSVVPLLSCSSRVIFHLYGNNFWKMWPLKRKGMLKWLFCLSFETSYQICCCYVPRSCGRIASQCVVYICCSQIASSWLFFFQVSINLLRRGQLFSLRLHEHLVQPSHLLNWNLLFHNIIFARWSIVGVSFVLLWPLSTFDGHRIVIWSVAAISFHAWKRAMLMLTHFDSRAATSWCY